MASKGRHAEGNLRASRRSSQLFQHRAPSTKNYAYYSEITQYLLAKYSENQTKGNSLVCHLFTLTREQR